MGSWVCLPSGAGGVTVSGALPRRALSALLLQRLPNPTSLLPSYQFYHNRRRVCASASSGAEELQQQQYLRSPDLVALEYADLNLTHKISEELGHVRIRQHVNPLSSSLSVCACGNTQLESSLQGPNIATHGGYWNWYILPNLASTIIGSGRFLIWLAKRNLIMKNYLGLEIRKKLVKRAEFWVKDLALSNIYFMFANATTSFQQLVSTYPGPLMLVSILCPDPYFKKRHHKRRVVQTPLVDSIVNNLMPSGQVFMQSDVLEVALDMRNEFDSQPHVLKHIHEIDSSVLCDSEGWVLSNPMGIRTEREIHAEFEGAKIYRRIYQKKMQLTRSRRFMDEANEESSEV